MIAVDRLAQPQQLDGGDALSSCTGGFTVGTVGGEVGIATAAHCGNTQSAEGQTLNFRSEDQQGNQDVQWHLACGLLDVDDNSKAGSVLETSRVLALVANRRLDRPLARTHASSRTDQPPSHT